MFLSRCNKPCRRGHSLIELVAAMIASAFLLAGLGSVMLIGRQVAYAPSAATERTAAADTVNQIAEELRYATLILQQTPQILEFVVADRNSDGTAEKIRYAWSGTPGDPLYKTVNSTAAVIVLHSVDAFANTLHLKSEVTPLTTTVDSAETLLASNASVQIGTDRDITATSHFAQQINPSVFSAIPSNVISWNATKFDFYGSKSGTPSGTLLVQLRASGDPLDAPTSEVLGQVSIAESALTSASNGWNTAVFPTPIRGLSMSRNYQLAWVGVGGAPAAKLQVNDTFPTGVFESTDSGASWQFMTTRMMFGRLYGTYTTPGSTYDITRNYASHIQLTLQSADQAHGRVEASIPLVNVPEILTSFWRADFSSNPTTTNANGDAAADWAVSSGSFDATKLINGVWHTAGALETRPLGDFTTTTIVEGRCRNTTVGGNGAAVRINADRQGGTYAPLLVYVRLQADGTQTLTLSGKSSDAATVTLCTRQRLASDFVRFRLILSPQNNVVNLYINDEDQGAFTYPTYAPSSSSDRFLTLYADTSLAEFDYIDVRVAPN